MKFSTRIDAHVPPADLFNITGDFSRTERALTERQVAVQRIDPAQDPGTGLGWNIDFNWHGQRRSVRLVVTHFDRPSHIALAGVSDQFDLAISITVIGLNRAKSRLMFETEVRPRSMRARLILQTAKLGKAQLDRKFNQKITDFLTHLQAA